MKSLRIPAMAGIAALSLVSPVFSQEADAGGGSDGRKVVDMLADYLANVPSLSASTQVVLSQSMEGQEPRDMTIANTILYQKDGAFSIQPQSDRGPGFSFVNGKAEMLYPGRGVVRRDATDAAAATVDSSFGFSENGSNQMFDRDLAGAILRGMIFQGEDRPWDRNLSDFKVLGEEDLDGVKTVKIGFTTKEEGRELKMPGTIWIDAGDKPAPRQVIIDMSPVVEEAVKENPNLKGLKLSMKASVSDWKPGVEIPGEAFALKVPADAEVAESLQALMSKGRPAPPADALVGTDAPDFDLKLLDGTDFKLSDHKGKVVVLDFWATWCGPCVKAMPILISTVEGFKEDGVVLVGVNLREEKEKVANFIEKQGWNLSVVLDAEGNTGGLYKVTGIPQTVIIGKDGKVKAVHVGANPATFKSELTGELKEALGAE